MSRKAAKQRVRGASQIMAQALCDGTMFRSGLGSGEAHDGEPGGRRGEKTGKLWALFSSWSVIFDMSIFCSPLSGHSCSDIFRGTWLKAGENASNKLCYLVDFVLTRSVGVGGCTSGKMDDSRSRSETGKDGEPGGSLKSSSERGGACRAVTKLRLAERAVLARPEATGRMCSILYCLV